MQTHHCRKEIAHGDALPPQWHSIPGDKFHHSCSHKCHQDKVWHSGTCCHHSITKQTNKLGPKHHTRESEKIVRHRNGEPKKFSSELGKCKDVVVIHPPPVVTLRQSETNLKGERKESETYMTVPLPAESTDSDCVRERSQKVTKPIVKEIEPKQVDVILPTRPVRVKLNFTNKQCEDKKETKREPKKTQPPKVETNITKKDTSAGEPCKTAKPMEDCIVKQRTIIDQYKEYLEHTQPSTRNWQPPAQGPFVYLINLLYSPIEWLKLSIFGQDKKKVGEEALIPRDDDDPEFVAFLRTYEGCPCMVSTLRKLFNEGKAKNGG